MQVQRMVDFLYQKFLSEKTKNASERVIITIAIASFLIHLGVFALKSLGIIVPDESSELLNNPIAAIYTPFSFILLYEVYLLVYYLPKSISLYITKQYEIITLVVIRRIFKDLSHLDLTANWFQSDYDLQLTYDLITTCVLFALIWLFYRLNQRAPKSINSQPSAALKRFIYQKKTLALLLVPTFVILALYSLGGWLYGSFTSTTNLTRFGDLNDIFFNEFFTILILADVLLLLFSLFQTDKFSKVIRNSSFIISTILIRLSFTAEGLTNNILVVAAVVFGVAILFIHNRFEQKSLRLSSSDIPED